MGNYPFLDTDETRFVSIAKEMLSNSDWINVRLNGENSFSYPPFLFWLINFSCFIFEKISAEIVNAFINYDKPQAPLLEYANSLGLFMFTKFALRIQPIIFKTVLNNPAKALMFLASQHVLWDSDDILEQNVFNKSLYGITHSPLDNLANVAMPMLGQFALGQRNPF